MKVNLKTAVPDYAEASFVNSLQRRVIELENDILLLNRLHEKEILQDRKEHIKSINSMGYTNEQLKEIIPKRLRSRFEKWMRGQTVALNTKGEILTYKDDVERFLKLQKSGTNEHYLEWD
jgi:predicted transcriptional regulator